MVDKIRPLHDRVLVERIEMEDMPPAGIIIPDAAKEKTQTGKVVAVGEGRLTTDGKRMPMVVKKGDVVFFGKYSGTEAASDNLLFLKEDEILGVVEQG